MNHFLLPRSIAIALLSLAASLLTPISAHADTLQFVLTGGANTISFNIVTMAGTLTGSPASSDAHTSNFSVSTTVNGGSPATDRVSFYDSSYGGGLVLRDANNQIVLSQTGYPSATLFTGPTSAPVFKLGPYSLTHDGSAQFNNDFTITITDLTPPPPPPTTPTAATPEPSTLLLLSTGTLGLAGAARRRIFPQA